MIQFSTSLFTGMKRVHFIQVALSEVWKLVEKVKASASTLTPPHPSSSLIRFRSVNIPWPTKGMADADYLYAFEKIVLPIAYEFAPELVISKSAIPFAAKPSKFKTLLVSAGFDAADGDVLGECHVTPAGFGHMTHMLSCLANGKMAVALEVSVRAPQ